MTVNIADMLPILVSHSSRSVPSDVALEQKCCSHQKLTATLSLTVRN